MRLAELDFGKKDLLQIADFNLSARHLQFRSNRHSSICSKVSPGRGRWTNFASHVGLRTADWKSGLLDKCAHPTCRVQRSLFQDAGLSARRVSAMNAAPWNQRTYTRGRQTSGRWSWPHLLVDCVTESDSNPDVAL